MTKLAEKNYDNLMSVAVVAANKLNRDCTNDLTACKGNIDRLQLVLILLQQERIAAFAESVIKSNELTIEAK